MDHYHDKTPSKLARLDEFAGRVSPVCNLIRQTADHFRAGVAPALEVRQPLVNSPAYTPEEYSERLAAFRRRLEAMVSFCERIGALAILVVPPANDACFEPNRSVLPVANREGGA